MELMQEEIRHGSDNIELTWTPRWLLSLAAREDIIAKREKMTASIKLTSSARKKMTE